MHSEQIKKLGWRLIEFFLGLIVRVVVILLIILVIPNLLQYILAVIFLLVAFFLATG